MIKVVEAISDSNVGGAGILLINRLKHSDRTRFDTLVALPKGSELVKRFEEIGINTKTINCRGNRSFSIDSFIRYYFLFYKIKPDIVNSHGSLSSRLAATLNRVPVRIYTRHCVFPLSSIYRYGIVRFIVGTITNFLSDKIIAVAHSAKNNLTDMGISSGKIKVIINGAEKRYSLNERQRKELRKKLGIEEDEIIITICARLEPCKDHKCLLRAARILKNDSKKYKILILGSGSLDEELKEYSKSLDVDDTVLFLGFAEDTSPYMNITDINVNCSVGTETSSLALSEGMSIGIPAVVSDYGGNPYMVRDGENGYVYKAGNYRELALLIKKISDAKGGEEYVRLSRNARRRYDAELNAKAMTNKTEKLYLNLYKAKKPKA